MSLLPTNFTLCLWDRQKNPRCSFGCLHTESMAHVLNGCIHHFKNYYSRRHDRIVEIISNFIKESIRRYRIHIDKHSTTVFPLLRNQLESIEHKKPDIHVVNHLEKKCFIVEITVCYDLYLEYARNTKYEKSKSLVECLSKNGYDVELLIRCSGSLGSVRNDAWKCLKGLQMRRPMLKMFLDGALCLVL